MVIDIHSHILPGIDDGAKTEKEALAMAIDAVAQGITTVIATPHHKNGKYENNPENIRLYVSVLNELFKKENIPLQLLPGQETRLNGDMLEDLKNNDLLTLNDSKYLFVEFPFSDLTRYSNQILFELQISGYIPIIVHPERNEVFIEHPSKLYEFVKQGVLTQVTAASVVGNFGRKVQKFSHQLIEANLTHFIASDAHNTMSRAFLLDDALQEVKKKYGSDYFHMFLENSQLLVDNMNVNLVEPSIIKRKKLLGLF